eukprot:TRINITY_DN10603_c0_g2_i1.p3 TRINITY_DN10603_c0_g2~~TRINITY_DN10603_c0_g2_i1.p3  ORF type:complete len:121 (-),score=6.48 TRINITY_DN10603_c0_g2_i1:909-1271(-)
MPKYPRKRRIRHSKDIFAPSAGTQSQPLSSLTAHKASASTSLSVLSSSASTQHTADTEETGEETKQVKTKLNGHCQLNGTQPVKCACEDKVNKYLDNLYICNKSGQLQRIINNVRLKHIE